MSPDARGGAPGGSPAPPEHRPLPGAPFLDDAVIYDGGAVPAADPSGVASTGPALGRDAGEIGAGGASPRGAGDGSPRGAGGRSPHVRARPCLMVASPCLSVMSPPAAAPRAAPGWSPGAAQGWPASPPCEEPWPPQQAPWLRLADGAARTASPDEAAVARALLAHRPPAAGAAAHGGHSLTGLLAASRFEAGIGRGAPDSGQAQSLAAARRACAGRGPPDASNGFGNGWPPPPGDAQSFPGLAGAWGAWGAPAGAGPAYAGGEPGSEGRGAPAWPAPRAEPWAHSATTSPADSPRGATPRGASPATPQPPPQHDLEDVLSILAAQVTGADAAADAQRPRRAAAAARPPHLPPSPKPAAAPKRRRRALPPRESGDESDDDSDDDELSDDEEGDAEILRAATAGSDGDPAKAALAKQRNREHARSTRRRKKENVDQLKAQVAELLRRQQHVASRHRSADTPEQRALADVRARAMRAFLEFRVTRVTSRRRWCDVVEEDVRTTLPATPLCPAGSAADAGGRLEGVDALVRDANAIGALVDMIERRANALRRCASGGSWRVGLTCVASADLLVAGDGLMCSWRAATSGLVAAGFDAECAVDGLARASFRGAKLRDVELCYDVLSFQRQLHACALIDLAVICAPPRPQAPPPHADLREGPPSDGADRRHETDS